jgi:hypothetical protein
MPTHTLQNEITGEQQGNFYSWAEASKASQNYGPEWFVVEI